MRHQVSLGSLSDHHCAFVSTSRCPNGHLKDDLRPHGHAIVETLTPKTPELIVLNMCIGHVWCFRHGSRRVCSWQTHTNFSRPLTIVQPASFKHRGRACRFLRPTRSRLAVQEEGRRAEERRAQEEVQRELKSWVRISRWAKLKVWRGIVD